MITKIVEVTNAKHGGFNWGKFLIGRLDNEWKRKSLIAETHCLLRTTGWSADHLLVLDLQTGEGAMFRPGGLASADLEKHNIWVCPLFEPFLTWLYEQDVSDLQSLPDVVDIPAPSALHGYRRQGNDNGERKSDR